jgi:hypothetical protein
MKKCFKCGEVKDLSAFYKHPQMADGHLNKCKECNKRDVRENRAAKPEYYKAFDRSRAMLPHRVRARATYQRTEEGKASVRKAKAKWSTNNPEKRAAQHKVNNAVRDGRLIKTGCEVCGSTTRIHGHHDDYTKPLDVRWLCAKHHNEAHKGLRL